MPSPALRHLLSSCLLSASFLSVCPAMAQVADAEPDVAEPQGPAIAPSPAEPSPSLPGAPAGGAVAAPALSPQAAEAARFAQFDTLRPGGQTTDFPGVYETITRDVGGFRTWLYDRDLYFRGSATNSFAYNVAGNRRPTRPQLYTGQRLTLNQTTEARLSWKIGGSGKDMTQINVGGMITRSTWQASLPNVLQFSNLNLYSSFFDKAVEIKIGYSNNLQDFVGIFAGGNPILASGVAASIPLSTGMSGGTAVTPSAHVTFNGGNGLYSRTGIQRSVLPAGLLADSNGSGLALKLTRTGARPLFLQEFGVRRTASADSRQIWLRAGGTYNLSDYNRIGAPGTERNWSLYALADYQVHQPDRALAYRGIYAGVSALFAPDAVNVYTRSLEARVYALGMVPGRPLDQATLTMGASRFSRSGGRALSATGVETHKDQFSVGALYSVHLTRGMFLSPSVTYIRNPSFSGPFRRAVNLSTVLAVLF